MLKPLLTPDQVAGLLHVSRRSVLTLDIPRVRVGRGRGKVLFREEDVEHYVRSRIEHTEEKGVGHGSRISQGQKKVGLSGLPSREMIQKIRLGYQAGSPGGGEGVPS